MLVLNSNTDTGGNVLTNQNVMINYPDIENSILLFPDRRYASYGTVATINGLTINMMGGEASKDNMFNLERPITTSSTFNLNHPPFVGGLGGGSANPVRLTTPLPIDQLVGQVVGKKIVLPDLMGNGSSPSIQVGLFHSDGTITYFYNSVSYSSRYVINPGRYGYIGSTSNYRGMRQGDSGTGTNYNQYVYVPAEKVIETDGIVVQEGDRPIAVMIWSTNYSIAFGGFIPTTQEERLKPIQISID